MDVKARSKPMRNILDRLLSYGEFEVILFGDHVILEEPVEHWPVCDVLLAFFSRGFPLQKAVEYSRLRKPFCVNDLLLQYVLLDRRLVLLVLDAIDVPTPRRAVVNRDGGPQVPPEVVELVSRDFNINLNNSKLFPQGKLETTIESGNSIQVGNEKLLKPFLEKPVNSEDHNIQIYYPPSMGGGCRKLFRKVANKSSEFVAGTEDVRQDGNSYVYEEFLRAENSEDVKVYTVGLHYAHAECRKAPVVDGIVRRNSEGKEIRTVTEMTCEEQEIARRVCMAFGQTICGFDIIRARGRSYVVDVNGWSFVKGNERYYAKCASILRDTFIRAMVSKRHSWKYEPFPSATEGQWRLKGYVCVLRHGDRTPKQKLKLTVKYVEFQELLPSDYAGEDVLIRDRMLIQKALDISRSLLTSLSPTDDNQTKLKQFVEVLGKKINVPGTKLQLRQLVRSDASPTLLLIIVKWGGDFTHAGRHHTKDLGESMRKELTILNKAVLDDVRIFCSTERRVLATAEVFAKALLGTAEVAPTFISVLKEALDDSFVSKEDVYQVKRRIGKRLLEKSPPNPAKDDDDDDNNNNDSAILLTRLKKSMKALQEIMKENLQSKDKSRLWTRWCCSDSLGLFKERWDKHFADVLDESTDWFDPSKISDLYDSLKFDALHHRPFLEKIFTRNEMDKSYLQELYLTAQKLFDYVAPKEYGMERNEILRIGQQISGLLLRKVLEDLQIALTMPFATCRLYFTKESHMTALLNLIKICGLPQSAPRPSHELCANELDYLSHICFELYERRRSDATGSAQTRYSLRIGLCNGAHNSHLLDLQLDSRHALAVTPKRWLTDYLEGVSAIQTLSEAVDQVPHFYGKYRGERKSSSEPMGLDCNLDQTVVSL